MLRGLHTRDYAIEHFSAYIRRPDISRIGFNEVCASVWASLEPRKRTWLEWVVCIWVWMNRGAAKVQELRNARLHGWGSILSRAQAEV